MNRKINTIQLSAMRNLDKNNRTCDGSTANALLARGFIVCDGFFCGMRRYKLTPEGQKRARLKADKLVIRDGVPANPSLMEDLP